MDNFQAIMLGRPVDVDLTDDGWTHHYAAVHHPPRRKGMTIEEYLRERARSSTTGSWRSTAVGSRSWSPIPRTAEILKPYYRYLCKRPCFHDEYLQAFNHPNVTLVDCPAGIERVTERGPVVDGQQYEVDCLVYGTGFEAELTPLSRRAGHDIVGRGGVTLAEKWADGAASLFGMMTRGFPNLFVMPAPGQQAVVTVNYTQLAVLGAEFVGARRRPASTTRGVQVFDVSAEAEEALDPEDRRLVRRRQPRHVGLHAVADQQRGPPRGDEPAQRQLRPRPRRLLRLPRPARAVARRRATSRASSSTRSAAPDGAVTAATTSGSSSSPAAAAASAPPIAEDARPHRRVRRHGRPARHPRRLRAAPAARGDHRRAASSPPADRPGPRRSR